MPLQNDPSARSKAIIFRVTEEQHKAIKNARFTLRYDSEAALIRAALHHFLSSFNIPFNS
jgi:hypothetical protein